MGGHSHDAEFDVPERTKQVLYGVAVGLAVLTVIAMVLLRPTGDDRPDLTSVGFGGDLYDAMVVSYVEDECPGSGTAPLPDTAEDPEGEPAGEPGTDPTAPEAGGPSESIRCALVVFELTEGPDAGTEVEEQLFDVDSTVDIDEGDTVVLRFDPAAGEGFEYRFTGDVQRTSVLVWLALLFAVCVVVLGRLRGLAALAGLSASLVILLAFILPAIIDGRSPLLVAVVGSAAIAYLALYLAHGFGPMTTVALLGTLSALVLTAILGIVFVDWATFSGLSSEDAFYLQAIGGQIDLRGLILAGVVIGALGAIDDMTVTQASAVWELHAANPTFRRRRLYRSAMEIGRDHVASTVNTLVLAYAGASMPLLLLFVLSSQSLGSVANTELVATEIVRTLVGSIGLVAAVPITTWLAALVAPQRATTRTASRPRPPRDPDRTAG